MTDLTNRVTLALRREGNPILLVGLTVAIFAAFSAASPSVFPSGSNLSAMGFEMPEVALLGLAVMLSMVTAGIDLSVVAIADLSGLAGAGWFHLVHSPASGGASGFETVVAIAIEITVGVICGAINGFVIGRIGVTPIVATLATSELFGGLALAFTNGNTVLGLPSAYTSIGSASVVGIPVPLVILAVASIAVALLLNRSRFGLGVVFMGSNQRAARLSGIHELGTLLRTYMVGGALAGIAGVIMAARTEGVDPTYGQSYILLAVVIVVLAGVDPNGGFGTVVGVLLATACLQMVGTGFTDLGYNEFLYEIVQGLILIAVFGLNYFVRTRRVQRVHDGTAGDVRVESA
jgi:simple sugar transport system permease protein